ncbi:FAD-binding oxidoreductase [Sinomonas terrae]|uniref:FAD-dependent oxidoreductase n=1 Tax=Sinomonas terrae TaxID=2908838 RepID=A0ABS9U3F5_9MICC|nr:FAD-dependent oxidoreductase [Sinomonas terrae]MCH6471228.1 FAD-dependent oxidoreductase [Sinomonas terrae]
MNRDVPGFEGELVWPGDEGYNAARRIWNGAIDRRPALIARCLDEEDASAALKYALSRKLPLSVRGGGHNVSGSALAEGGVVIDFSALRGVVVDPDSMSVRVQPGALWGEVDAAAQEHGLAVPAGIVTHTGVAGLTLGGGFGWLSRRWGLTSDNLLSVAMLLADGSRVHASEDENPDLFWAVQGAAATSASRPNSASRPTASAPTSWQGPSSSAPSRRRRSSPSTANSSPKPRTSSPST